MTTVHIHGSNVQQSNADKTLAVRLIFAMSKFQTTKTAYLWRHVELPIANKIGDLWLLVTDPSEQCICRKMLHPVIHWKTWEKGNGLGGYIGQSFKRPPMADSWWALQHKALAKWDQSIGKTPEAGHNLSWTQFQQRIKIILHKFATFHYLGTG